jgi:hypothetical protein
MYRRNMICSHSLAAATMHSALLRNQYQQQRQPGSTDRRTGSPFSNPSFSTTSFPGVSEFNSEMSG